MEGSNPSLEWDELELKTSQVYLCVQLHMGGWVGGWGCIWMGFAWVCEVCLFACVLLLFIIWFICIQACACEGNKLC